MSEQNENEDNQENESNDSNIIYEPATTKHWRNLFPKKSMLLGCQNLNPGEELVLTIKSIEKEATVIGAKGRKDSVSLLHFEDCKLPMCLNVTKSRVLESLYGGYTDGWIGKPIQIFAGMVKEFGGSGKIPGLCIRQFKPNINEDISEYEDKIYNSANIDELKKAFVSIPKHIQGRLVELKDKRKQELS